MAVVKGTARSAAESAAHILRIADAIFAQEGEQGLQMKDLASRASVSLATLYQHYPSKDHVLGAIALERQRQVAARLRRSPVPGETAGERAGEVMMQELRTVQNHPEMAAALQRVANVPNRSTSEYIAGIREAMEEMVRSAIADGGEPATPEQLALLPTFLSACSGAMNLWLSGVISVEQARRQVRVAQRLFDLPPALAAEHLLDA